MFIINNITSYWLKIKLSLFLRLNCNWNCHTYATEDWFRWEQLFYNTHVGTLDSTCLPKSNFAYPTIPNEEKDKVILFYRDKCKIINPNIVKY